GVGRFTWPPVGRVNWPLTGTVFALRGEVRSVRISRAIVKTVLPSDVVARQRVPAAGEFGFSLVPGRYVIDLAQTLPTTPAGTYPLGPV
ncbi:MAG: hypothetical protein ACYCXN_06675, partial [Acidimicrobiales bacterium]